jgi:hypothetical protein
MFSACIEVETPAAIAQTTDRAEMSRASFCCEGRSRHFIDSAEGTAITTICLAFYGALRSTGGLPPEA